MCGLVENEPKISSATHSTFSPALATERVVSIARRTFYRSSTKTAVEYSAEISAILSENERTAVCQTLSSRANCEGIMNGSNPAALLKFDAVNAAY